jgi:hypothetical protein
MKAPSISKQSSPAMLSHFPTSSSKPGKPMARLTMKPIKAPPATASPSSHPHLFGLQ